MHRNKARHGVALLAALALIACTDDRTSPIAPKPPRLNSALLTSAALQSLDRNGRFILPSQPPGLLAMPDAQRAAMAYLKTYGPLALREYVKQSGVRFEISDLRPCGDPLFAQSSYDYAQISDSRIRLIAGPHWIMSACTSSGIPVVAVSLSALTLDLGERAARQRLFDPTDGDFYDFGIPPRFSHGVPISPESAAVIAGHATGALVAATPELIQPAVGQGPLMSRWRVPLDQSVVLRNPRTALSASSTSVYVGYPDEEYDVSLLVADTGLLGCAGFDGQ